MDSKKHWTSKFWQMHLERVKSRDDAFWNMPKAQREQVVAEARSEQVRRQARAAEIFGS